MMAEYEAQCRRVIPEAELPAWLKLGEVLVPRRERGWRFNLDEEGRDGPLWTFGIGGTALLVADVRNGSYHVFDYGADEDLFFTTASDMERALPPLELANRGLTPLQQSILESDTPLDSGSLEVMMAELERQDRAFDRDEFGNASDR